MIFSQLAGFTLASLALALMPGPDNIYVLTESLSKGWRQGVLITTGLISGVLVHTTLVATGASLILFAYPWFYDLVKYLGALYLLWLAYGAFRESPIPLPSGVGEKIGGLKLISKGFTMNVLNPKVTLFFMVLLPQFVHEAGWPPFYQMLVLGGIFMGVSFLVFSSVAWLAGRLNNMISRPWFWRTTKAIKVLVLVILAITLALSSAS